jgi:hypothetical protein
MAKARLKTKLPIPGMSGELTFDFNPDDISMMRKSNTRNRSTTGQSGTSPSITKKTPPPQVKISKFVLEGSDVKDRCDMLLDWMTPGGGFLGRMIGAAVSALSGGLINLATRPPELNFQWGSGFDFDCILSQANVKYIRFDDDGNATRAEVSNILLEMTPWTLLDLLPTNPTSGGAPGRRSHLVTAGENLPMLALNNYGAPKHWRALADTNGIDDPLRIKPGQHLYLPNPEELLGSR